MTFQSAANCRQIVGMNRDSTTATPLSNVQQSTGAVASSIATATAIESWLPALGLHYIQGMEQGSGTVTSTYFGAHIVKISIQM
jgi:hypothetical protein